jgi:hypothetical protein
MTLKTTWEAVKASFNPLLPIEAAMMTLGMMLMLRVNSRRSHGLTVQLSIPSLTICPAIVHTFDEQLLERIINL